MKIPLQEKIAELEARIVDLEKNAEFHTGFARRSVDQNLNSIFGKHWKKMWEHFDKVMESI